MSHARMRFGLLAAAPLLFAVISLILGKKTGWDFHNYHWYNPFALLTGRFYTDVGVGHHATYYNPLPDVPLYLIGSTLPPWAVGIFLGALAGIAVALVGLIAYETLTLRDERKRIGAASAVALLGAIGAGAWQEIGDPANDITAAIGIFASLWIMLARHERTSLRLIAFAGALCGAAVGLKLTTAPFALGLLAVALCYGGTFKTRLLTTLAFGVSAFIGMLICGGFWMFRLWEFSGSPLFPYFNDVLKSPLILDESYRDLNFRPDSWREFVLFPFLFAMDSLHVSEASFRDVKIAVLYVLLPVMWLLLLTKKVQLDVVAVPKFKLLLIFSAVSYFSWAAVFGIYRYLIPLEMMAPLLIAASVALLPIPNRLIVFAVAMLAMQSLTRVDLSDRQAWNEPYVEVDAPAWREASGAMVLMTGYEPMSYVIPSFPRDVPFLRIDGWLVHGSDRATGLARRMRERVAAHTGPLWVLFAPMESQAMMSALQHYELDLHADSCRTIASNIGNALQFCQVSKPAT